MAEPRKSVYMYLLPITIILYIAHYNCKYMYNNYVYSFETSKLDRLVD